MKTIPYHEHVTAFIEAQKVRRTHPDRIATMRSVLGRFGRHLGRARVRDVRAISEAHVTAFLAGLREQKTARGTPFSPITIRTWLHYLRSFFRFLEAQQVVLRDPTTPVDLPRIDKLPKRALSVSESEKLMESPDLGSVVGLRNRAILETLYGTGVRTGECARLDVMDVDLAGGRLLIRDGKGRKDRYVPLAGRAAQAIDVYLKDSRPCLRVSPKEPALFLSFRTGTRLGGNGIQQVVSQCAEVAGLRYRVGPHALRHTCATHLLKGGADIRHVQAILGHKSLQSTQVYTRVQIADVKAMVEKSHPRERRSRRSRIRSSVRASS